MCTVLQLTERLLLDHAQRLPESKVQYVECTCCLWSMSDLRVLLWALGGWARGLAQNVGTLGAFVSTWLQSCLPGQPRVSLFAGSTTVPWWPCCWVGPGTSADRPIKQLRSSYPLWEGTSWPMGSWRSSKWFSVLIRWVASKSLLRQMFECCPSPPCPGFAVSTDVQDYILLYRITC